MSAAFVVIGEVGAQGQGATDGQWRVPDRPAWRTGDELLTGMTEPETPTLVRVDSSPASVHFGLSDSKRRFTFAVLIGVAVAAVPYFWVLFDLWNGSL